MAALLVEQERRMEDLESAVGIHRRVNPGDAREIAIEELGKTNGVVRRPSSRAAGDEELEAGNGKRVLQVHEQKPHGRPVHGRRSDGMPLAKLDGVAGAFAIGNAVDLADSGGIEMVGERQFAHQKTSTAVGVCEEN
jgi:hypothetical protein